MSSPPAILSARLTYALIASAFCLALAAFALARNPRHRLNRAFALLNVFNATLQLSGLAHAFVTFGWMTHDQGLLLYRVTTQISGLGLLYYVTAFVQELIGIYETRAATGARRALIALIVLSAPLGFTPLVIEDFFHIPLPTRPFTEVVGPVFLFFIATMIAGYIAVGAVVLHHARIAVGEKKNQLKFLVFAMALGVMGFAAKYYSVRQREIALVYFVSQLGATFTCAYVIFKYRLFDFNLWMRRAAIFTGVYVILSSLPFLLFIKWRTLPAEWRTEWWLVPSLAVAYALLFSAAPTLAAYLRDRAEDARWSRLRRQMRLIADTSERLADESRHTLEEISTRVRDLLRDFYEREMNQPIRFVLVALVTNGRVAAATHPALNVDDKVLQEFIRNLSHVPMLASSEPFSLIDVDQQLMKAENNPIHRPLSVIRSYLHQNQIEICCPCSHHGKIFGALLFGSKTKGIFLQEELAGLHMAAAHIATAVRKSELLERSRSLHELDMLKKELIANITHEFKSPLANIENAITILRRDQTKGLLDSAKVERYLNMIHGNAERLTGFIQNLLEVAKIEQPDVELDLEEGPLRALLQEACAGAEATAAEKGLLVRLSPGEEVRVAVDRPKMMQVFANVIGNAVKFTEKGSVVVSVGTNDGRVRVRVDDTGPGIDPRYLQAIFDRFFQAPDGPRSASGTGLGLAIAKGWAEAHGGKIWAESHGIGRGASFIIELPIAGNRPAIS